MEALPPRNLVFLLDVSGSMEDENKLPLLKRSFSKLLDTLGERDRVAIVVYAGASGLVLPSTPASERRTIEAALERLSAGGSTNGASGIELAYQVALEHTVKEGINRVILATDGDFNVGTTSESALTELIEEKREHGVSLSVLGFGMGNYNDSTLERLADNGNGNYAYIDTLEEAHKVLVTEVSGTLLTIAKDVKIQVEFNPAVVGAYRLIGYDNRRLADRDFNDDRKDAGEIGAGHRVTALYEVLTPAQASKLSGVDPLKYQTLATSGNTNEMLTVKLRHKDPEAKHSQLQKVTVANRVVPLERASDNLRFASAVAAFGMYLRQSEHGGNSSPALALDLARGAVGEDRYGYRKEFIQLVSLSAGVNRQAIAR
jgi:Ca-activated chloride channel family protein